MTSAITLTLLGFGLGALLLVNAKPSPRKASLRDRTIEAQEISARAAQRARELADQWSAEQDKDRSS